MTTCIAKRVSQNRSGQSQHTSLLAGGAATNSQDRLGSPGHSEGVIWTCGEFCGDSTSLHRIVKLELAVGDDPPGAIFLIRLHRQPPQTRQF